MAIEEMNPQAVLVSPEDEQVRVSGPIRGPAQGGGQAVPPLPPKGLWSHKRWWSWTLLM